VTGIMVSVHGFTETAKKYARALKIDLLRLVDAEQKMWAEYFETRSRRFARS
jgi:hypothetical protein